MYFSCTPANIQDPNSVFGSSLDGLNLGQGEITFDGNGSFTENTAFNTYELERTRTENFTNLERSNMTVRISGAIDMWK